MVDLDECMLLASYARQVAESMKSKEPATANLIGSLADRVENLLAEMSTTDPDLECSYNSVLRRRG